MVDFAKVHQSIDSAYSIPWDRDAKLIAPHMPDIPSAEGDSDFSALSQKR